jgi:hypothetical protein
VLHLVVGGERNGDAAASENGTAGAAGGTKMRWVPTTATTVLEPTVSSRELPNALPTTTSSPALWLPPVALLCSGPSSPAPQPPGSKATVEARPPRVRHPNTLRP